MSTNSQKKQSDLRKIGICLIIIGLALIGLLLLGCSPTSKPSPEPQAVAESVTSDSGIYVFGQTVDYGDGISAAVSAPEEFLPSETSAGAVEGQTTLSFKMAVTNNSSDPFDPVTVLATVASGNSEASGVFDTANGVGFPPMTSVLPGQTIEWTQAWSVSDPESLTLELNVGFTRGETIYTNIQ